MKGMRSYHLQRALRRHTAAHLDLRGCTVETLASRLHRKAQHIKQMLMQCSASSQHRCAHQTSFVYTCTQASSACMESGGSQWCALGEVGL